MESQPLNTLEQQSTAPPIDRPKLSSFGYTARFSALVVVGVGFVAMQDLGDKETSKILVSFGLSSTAWAWFWLFAGALLTWFVAAWLASASYYVNVEKRYKNSNPLDSVEAGITDIWIWSGLLAYFPILIIAGLIPGRFGVLRLPIIIVSSLFCAAVLSIVLTQKTIRALYGPSRIRKSISRKQCDMMSIMRAARCQRWAFRTRFQGAKRAHQENLKYLCRWHLIPAVTAQKNQTKPRASVGKQHQATYCLFLTLICAWNYTLDGKGIWLAVMVFTFGAMLRYLSDSIMAPWHALSRLAIWGKLFATGLGLQVISGIALLALIGWRPELIKPIVAFVWPGQVWLSLGPAIIYIFAILLIAGALDALLARVLFFTSPSWAPLFILPTFLPIWNMLSTELPKYWPFSTWVADEFWSPVIGPEFQRTWGGAFILSYGVPSVLFKREQREYSSATIAYVMNMMRFFSPVVVTLVSIMTSRYLLYSLGIGGPYKFVAVTLALSILLSVSLMWLGYRLRRE